MEMICEQTGLLSSLFRGVFLISLTWLIYLHETRYAINKKDKNDEVLESDNGGSTAVRAVILWWW